MPTIDDFAATINTTGSIAPGQPATGNLETSGDSDWFKTTLDQANVYRFHGYGASAFDHLDIFNAQGALAARLGLTISSSGQFETSWQPATAGDYYLAVSGGPSSSAYGVYMQSKPAVDDIGDTHAGALAMTLGQQVSAILDGPIDHDVFKLSVHAGTTYLLDLQGDGASVTLDGGVASGAGKTSFTAQQDGDVFYEVNTLHYDATKPQANIAYTLTASLAPDDYAANAAGAGQLAIGGTLAGAFEAVGADRDWFGVQLTAGTTYWLSASTDGSRDGEFTGLNLRLLDSNGALLAMTSPMHPTVHGISFKPGTSGTYFCELSNYFGHSGSYHVSAAVGTPDDVPDGQALALQESVVQRGAIELTGDSDDYTLATVAGHTYEFLVQESDGDRLGWMSSLAGSGGSWLDNRHNYEGKVHAYTFVAGSNGAATLHVDGELAANGSVYTIVARDAGVDDHHGSFPHDAAVLAENGSAGGVLEAAGDVDSFVFHARAGVSYAFELRGAASAAGSLQSSPDLHNMLQLSGLFDNANLGQLDASAAETRLLFTATETADVRLDVMSVALRTGSYTLEASTLSGDTTAPLLAAKPLASIGLAEAMRLTFNEAVKADAGALRLLDAAGAVVAAGATLGLQVIHDTLLLDPPGLLQPGQTYRLELAAGAVSDLAGNHYQGPASFSFSTPAAASQPSAGNDVLVARGDGAAIDGGAGVDTVSYAGQRADYTIGTAGGKLTVLAKGAAAADTLHGVERLYFADQAVALDSADVFQLYRAAFNRVPDGAGLGYWMAQHDQGVDLGSMAKAFATSAEFSQLYGMAPSNAEFVNQLYANVLHRPGEAAGVAFWTAALGQGASRAEVLLAFSASAENAAASAALVADGFSYIPW